MMAVIIVIYAIKSETGMGAKSRGREGDPLTCLKPIKCSRTLFARTGRALFHKLYFTW